MPTSSRSRLWKPLASFLLIWIIATFTWGSGVGPNSAVFSSQSLWFLEGAGYTPRFGFIDLGLNVCPLKITNSGYVLTVSPIPTPANQQGAFTAYRWQNGASAKLLDSTGNIVGFNSSNAANVADMSEDGTIIGNELINSSPYPEEQAIWAGPGIVPPANPATSQTDSLTAGPNFQGSSSLQGLTISYVGGHNIFWDFEWYADTPYTNGNYGYNAYYDIFKNGNPTGLDTGALYSTAMYNWCYYAIANNSGNAIYTRGPSSSLNRSLADNQTLNFWAEHLSNPIDAAGDYVVLGFNETNSNGSITQTPVWWLAGTTHTDLPQAVPSDSLFGVNAAMAAMSDGNGGTILKPAVQIVGTATNVGYSLWQMNPTTQAFGTPQAINQIIPANGDWSGVVAPIHYVNPINDNGLILAMANYTPQSPTDPIAAGQHGVILIPTELAVDADRNGTIVLANENPTGQDPNGNPVDVTTQAKPFRFWVNNDDDNGSGTGGTEVVPATTPDYNSPNIVSERDLEDWTRLWIYTKGLNTAINAGTIKIGLKWKNYTGTPGIKLVKATDSDGGLEYLTDTTGAAAAAQTTTGGPLIVDAGGSHTNIVPTSNAADFVFPTSMWTNLTESAPKTFLLFEGTSVGKGQLEVVFLKTDGTTKMGEGGNLWLDLRDIKEMYLREVVNGNNPAPLPYTWNNSTPPIPSLAPSIDNSNSDGNSGTFVADPNEDTSHPNYVVFVHGYNMLNPQSTNYAETMFKRLWQRGYKGRFAAFRWPTFGNGTTPLSLNPLNWLPGGALGTYNDSEYEAWNSGTALKTFVGGLPSAYAGHVDIISHSLGSVVVGEALEEGMSVSHYVMSHAAASAMLYGNSTSTYPTVNSGSVPDNDSNDPYTRALGYSALTAGGGGTYYNGWLGGINTSPAGQINNFYSDQDKVISVIWNYNNSLFKPQSTWAGVYGYSGLRSSEQKLYLLHGLSPYLTYRNVTSDSHASEAKAYVDYSLSGTVGSETTTAGSVNLNTSEHNSNTHSYEWDNPLENPNVYSFYSSLMGPNAFNLNPIP